MSKLNFDIAVEEVFEREGGFANLEGDRGGKTNLGITERVYLKYCKEKGIVAKRIEDITKDDARPIYKDWYWDAMKCDFLPAGIDYLAFDFCVHSGEGNATRVIQKMVGAVVDGAFGNNTLGKVLEYIADGSKRAYKKKNVEAFIKLYSKNRLEFIKKTYIYKRYPTGMENRVAHALEASLDILNKRYKKKLGDIKMFKALKGKRTFIASTLIILSPEITDVATSLLNVAHASDQTHDLVIRTLGLIVSFLRIDTNTPPGKKE